jgi:hypothetical protein
MTYRDEIIAEIWRIRDAYAARHHNSLNEMVADLRERQKRPGCKLVDRREKGSKPTSTAVETQRQLT